MSPPQQPRNQAPKPSSAASPPPTLPYQPTKRQAPNPSAPPPPPQAQPYQRPPKSQWKPVEPLPAKYKPVARRVTLAIVAAPIAIVTSWALYDRMVLGHERKEISRLVPGLAKAAKEELDAGENNGKN